MEKKYFLYKVILFLSFLSFAVYANHLENSFHFDGVEFIVQNPEIRDLKSISNSIVNAFKQRSLIWSSFMLNYYFGQYNPFGYHLLNLVLHTLNGILVYILVRMVQKNLNKNIPVQKKNNKTFIPLCSATLFVIHPIQTESVAYIMSRSELLFSFFYLFAFILFQLFLIEKNKGLLKSLVIWGGIFFMFTLAIGSKESSVTFPGIAALYYLIQAPPDAPIIKFLKKWRYLIVLTVIILLILLFERLLTDETFLMGRPTDAGEIIGRKNYMLTEMFVIFIFYIKLLIFPINLNPDPDIPMIVSVFDPLFFLPVLILTGLSIWVFQKNRNKILIFGFIWCLVTISPTSSIITLLDFAAEHRLYLPSIGFFIMTSYGLHYIFDSGKVNAGVMGRMGACSVLVILLSVITISRNYDWRSSLTLWENTLKKSPKKGRPYMNVGYAYDEIGETDKAITFYKKAIKLSVSGYRIHYNLGKDYRAKGRVDDALNEFLISLQLDPNVPEIYANLGEIYLEKRNFKKADLYFKKAVEIKPDMDIVFRNLGILHYDHLKNLKQAYLYFSISLRLNPDQNQASEIRKLLKQLDDEG